MSQGNRGGGVETCPLCRGAGEFQTSHEMDLIGIEITPLVIGIIKTEAERAGIKVGDIIGQSHVHRVAKARFRVACRMRDELDMTFKAIGIYLGNRDHSTIINEINQARRRGWYENG